MFKDSCAGADTAAPCRLSGEAAAGCTGDASSIVLAGRVAGSAYLSIAGLPVAAGALQAAGRDSQLMLSMDAAGAAGPLYQVRAWNCVHVPLLVMDTFVQAAAGMHQAGPAF
jgi:hypothetical protein